MPYDRIVRWIPVQGAGADQVRLRELEDGWLAEGAVIGARAGTQYALSYRIRTDRSWRTRAVEIESIGAGVRLKLDADGAGGWWDEIGKRPDLTGCLDVDLAATPFTNTLPIRRLGDGATEPTSIRVVYVPVPDLKAHAVDQRYTCLEPGRRWLYEGLFRGYAGELSIDADGLVIDYPRTFLRVRESV